MKPFTALAVLTASTLFDTAYGRFLFRRAVDPATTDPNDDPFYTAPSNISKYANGAWLDNRTVSTFVQGAFTKANQIKYKTTDGQGNAVVTVATVWAPLNPNKPARIFGYQVPEDAINLDCDPSWAWVQNTQSDNTAVIRAEAGLYIPWAINQGYYVVIPDAEGPQATWLVGKMEGQAALDANRAAIAFLGLDKTTTKLALYGYSGGGHSTVWAASLAATYAPDLNVVGAAYGGTPVDLISTFELINGGNQSILAGAALFGLALGYPTLQNNYQTGSDGLTTQGKSIQKLFVSRNYCPAGVNATIYNGTDWNTYFKGPLLNNTVLMTVAKRESLLMNVSSIGVPVPLFPRFEYHGDQDVTVPYAQEVQYVQQQCAKGANIQFRTYANQDHAGADIAAMGDVHFFINAAFNNNTQTCQCGTQNCTN